MTQTESGAPLGVGELRHELRTPVNHIVGYTEMLLEDTEDPAFAGCRRSLEDILSAAREVLLLINGGHPPPPGALTLSQQPLLLNGMVRAV